MQLLPYQAEGVDRITKFKGRALLADDMGLGKTIQSLYWKYKYAKDETTIIVCPAHLKWNWKRECKVHFGIKAYVLSGTVPDRVLKPGRTYIINYDILSGWIKRLIKIQPKLVIIDECQKVKNRTIKRTKETKKLARVCEYFIACSGTPIENKPAEFWSVLNMINKEEFPNFYQYAMRYCSPKRTRWGWTFDGATKTKELNNKLNKICMIRRRKTDVLKDLPDKVRITTPLEIQNYKEYEKAEKHFIIWLTKAFGKQRASSASKVEQMAQIGYLKRLAGTLKRKSLIEWIDNFLDSGEKLIVFGIHKSVMLPLVDHYKNCCTLVNGTVIGSERQKRVDRFNRDPGCKILFGNIQAAGSGWSCTSASNVAFAEFEWNPSLHVQAEDRIHGVKRGIAGQTSFCHYLYARNTIEEKLLKINQNKQKAISKILDGKMTKDDLNIYDILCESMLRNQTK